MTAKMWIGTRQNRFQIPVPSENSSMPAEGWSSRSKTLGGGARVRKSIAGARAYYWEWPVKEFDDVRRIFDLADGAYDSTPGKNYIYFVSPDTKRLNCAPQRWAWPASTAFDAMPLIRGARPTTISTPSNTQNYPALSAVYEVTGDEEFEVLYIPIDPGHTLWIGAHGSATGDTGIQVTPYNGDSAGSTDALTLLGANTTTRVNASYASSDYTGVEVQIIPDAGTLTFTGLIVQMLPDGISPVGGDWIGGLGNEGCEFDGKPTRNVYRVYGDSNQVVVTANLVETRPWR